MSTLAILGLFVIVGVPLSARLYLGVNEGARPFRAFLVCVFWTVGTIAATVFGIFFC